MPRFAIFTKGNSYAEPYSSATGGPELITEFNQRAQLNVLGWKELEWVAGNSSTRYVAKMSGCKTSTDLNLSIAGANLRIAPGEALICGYYLNLQQELLLPLGSLITAADIGTDRPDDYVKTRFIKLQILTTQSANNPYDERLVPPTGATYSGIEVIVDDTLPQQNQLLLGTVSRNVIGSFSVTNNEARSRLIDISRITGAENYDRLIAAPEAGDTSIYGIKYGATDSQGKVTHRLNINPWTWLAYNSVLGRYLRNMARVPDDAGSPGGGSGSSSLQMLSSPIGWSSAAGPIGGPDSSYSTSDNKILRLKEQNAHASGDTKKPYLAYRVLKNGQSAPDCYDEEYIPLPFSRYTNRADRDDVPSVTGGYSGIIDSKTLKMIDTLWEDRDSLMLGRQFGPFANPLAAESYFQQHSSVTLQENDYYWVISDTVSNYPDPSDPYNPTLVDYGTVESTYTARTAGNITVTAGSTSVTMTGVTTEEISGTFTGTLQSTDLPSEEYDVTGELTNLSGAMLEATGTWEPGSFQGTATGTGTGTASFDLKNFVQNVSARYVYLRDDPTDTSPNPSCSWKRQAVLRGFAAPATTQTYGFVRPSSGAEIGDVINDPDKNQLRLDLVSRTLLKNGGWYETNDSTPINLAPDSPLFDTLPGTRFTNGTTIVLIGSGWDADSVPHLKRLRGDIKLDISQAVASGQDVAAILTCEDIDQLTIVTGSSSNKINVADCVITTSRVNSISHWVGSRFDSGSNTAVVNNPWITAEGAFSSTYTNSLQTRIVKFTRGEWGIESAEMDIWIKRESWTEPYTNDNFTMVTKDKLKFPPLILALDDDGNVEEVDFIPDGLNAKIAGTGGVHKTWDDTAGTYVMTGNWICTLDWQNGEELSLNGRVLSPANDRITGLYDVRFRALIQFTHADDMMERSISYSDIYS